VSARVTCDGMSAWACPIRIYITVADEMFPAVVDVPGWAGLGEYLSGSEFAGIAGRVQYITIINRQEVKQ
jgi:hypothetical protein